uniref:Mlo family n=1 Tax=Siphoviridae sp. ctQLz13 TaxID=2825492 RepID=A0A8S5NUH7_9CAUD|nr:MAG TPA: Mlo family [Siphoviridae sp. ctQLz13]DAY87735.1 MAG TPA: Mlo family [Caudoviricetes sp.]
MLAYVPTWHVLLVCLLFFFSSFFPCACFLHKFPL